MHPTERDSDRWGSPARQNLTGLIALPDLEPFLRSFQPPPSPLRRILIDTACKRRGEKGGGRHRRVAWHDNIAVPVRPIDHLLAIDEALTELAAHDPESARLVKFRSYAGLLVGQAAEMMGVSRATAYCTWAYGKVWLRTKLAETNTR